jgi:Cys-rich repeat protein
MRLAGLAVSMLGVACLVVVAMGAGKMNCVPVEPEEPVCAVAADCEGLPHVSLSCDGEWTCQEGSCVWQCKAVCKPVAEACGDGEDNDCDGAVDEGCCLADSDCGKGEVCEFTGPCPMCYCDPGQECPDCLCWGTCVEKTTQGACYSDLDCLAGQYCQITNNCCPPADCKPGQPCDAVCVDCGVCVDEPVNPACYGDGDCGKGEYCMITDDCCPPKGCDPGEDCPAVCEACGICVADGPLCCEANWECPNGMTCVAGVCEELPGPGECWSDKDCKAGQECVGVITCPCGALCFAASQPGKCQPAVVSNVCYDDSDCAEGEQCNITNDCCAPKGCTDPSLPCPDVCVSCGECGPKESECSQDADCKPGFACQFETYCPPCTYADPPCMAPCMAIGTCIPLECSADSDCPAGTICQPTEVCPDCVYEWPPCKAPCQLLNLCVPGQPACKVLDPYAYGICAMFLGYGFDGSKCMGISGCGWGNDKAYFFDSLEACKQACLAF